MAHPSLAAPSSPRPCADPAARAWLHCASTTTPGSPPTSSTTTARARSPHTSRRCRRRAITR
eukprot:5019790-Prymnesium_polylepis.1